MWEDLACYSVWRVDWVHWYTNTFFYSPLFAICWIPFDLAGPLFCFLILTCFLVADLRILFTEIPLEWWTPFAWAFILPHLLNFYILGNLDIFLVWALVRVQKIKDPYYRGIVFGLLCFKGSVLILAPLLFLRESQKWQIAWGLFAGLMLNYGMLLFNPWVLRQFINHIPSGLSTRQYLWNYPWLWIYILWGASISMKRPSAQGASK